MPAIGLPFRPILHRPGRLASVLQAASKPSRRIGQKSAVVDLSYRPVVDSEAFLVRLGLRESFCADSHHIV